MSKTGRGGDFRLNSDISIAIGLRLATLDFRKCDSFWTGWNRWSQKRKFSAVLTSFSRIFAKNTVSSISPCCMLLGSLLLLTPTHSVGLADVDNTTAAPWCTVNGVPAVFDLRLNKLFPFFLSSLVGNCHKKLIHNIPYKSSFPYNGTCFCFS